MRNVTISLIAVALIAGMVGCGEPVDNPPVIDGYHIIVGNTTADYVRPEQGFDLVVGVSDDYGTKAVSIEIPGTEISENLEEMDGSWHTDNTITLTEEGSYTIYITAIDTSDQTDSLEGSILCQEIEPGPCDYECQQATPGGWLGYQFEHSGFSKYEVVFNWSDTPQLYDVGIYPALLHFWFEAGQGGYTGPQIEVYNSGETIVKKVIFSIWSMNNEQFTAHPYAPDCGYGDTEGNFVRCMITDYDWIEGKEYKIAVQKDEELEDGVVWKATIEDLETEVETLIGKIKLDDQEGYKGYGLLTGNTGGFFEYYLGSHNRCLEAEYGKIMRIGPVADDMWLPRRGTYQHSECIRAITYSPEPGVVIEEVGEGVERSPEEPIANVVLWEYDHDILLSTLPEELQELFE